LNFAINRRVESHIPLPVIFQPDPANPTPASSASSASLWLGAEILGDAAVADVLNGAVGVWSIAAAVVSTPQRDPLESAYLIYLSRVFENMIDM
jgi:hypothetical protein